MNINKIIYGIKKGTNTIDCCWESRQEAEKQLENFINEDKENVYCIIRLMFFPKKCSHCGHFELMTIPDNEPWKPITYQCPSCDSTYDRPE